MTEQDPLAHLCPLCGQSNSCAQVEQSQNPCQPLTPNQCWCMSANLNIQSRDSLAAQTNGKRCLCQNCLQKAAQSQQ